MARNLFFIVAAVWCFSLKNNDLATASDVFVVINNLEATMGNAFINISFKSDASIQSLFKNGKNLVAKVSKRKGYLDWNGGKHRFNPSSVTLVEENEDLVHVMYLEEGSSSVLRIEFHIILLSNVSGIYHYVKASNSHSKTIELSEFRTVHRFSSALMPQISNGVRHGIPPLQKVLDTRPTIQDATWQLEDGSYYTKYDYANYIRETPWFGTYGGGFGAWLVSASREYHSGGPLKQDLLVHQDSLICNYLTGSHFGTPSLKADPGWSKFYGPWLLYFNEGADTELLEDVAKRSELEQLLWPYRWVSDTDYPLSRGSLSGKITGQLKAAVVLHSSVNETFDLQTKGYLYSTVTNEDGYFNFTNVRPGEYRLTTYPLAGYGSENLAEKDVVIKEGIQDAGTLSLPEPTGILWSIGETNRRADNFRYSDEQRNFYWQLLTPANHTFVIGKSNTTNNWYYTQSRPGTWRITFPDAPDGQERTLRVAVAAASGTAPRFQVAFNDVVLGDFEYKNDQAIYRQAMQSGNFHSTKFTVAADQIVNGENVISLIVIAGKFMYDSISFAK